MKKNTLFTLIFSLAVTAGLSLATYRAIQQNTIESLHTKFNTLAASAAYRLEQRIRENSETMYALQVCFDHDAQFDTESFAKFTQNTLKRHPAIAMFAWVPKVEASQRVQYEKKPVAQDEAEVGTHSESDEEPTLPRQDQGTSFLIDFQTRNFDLGHPTGFDLYTVPEYRTAIDHAIQSGEVTASLVFKPDQPGLQKASYFFAPVYRGTPDETSRKETVQGVIMSLIVDRNISSYRVFDAGQIFKDLVVDISNSPLQTDNDGFVAEIGKNPDNFFYQYKFPHAEMYWTLTVTRSNDAKISTEQAELGAGLLFVIGALLSLFIVQQMNKRIAIEETVRERTNELKKTTLKLRRSMKDIADAKDSAEQANQLKSEFLANMSHEIRTPLNGVLGMCQLLEQTSLDSQQKEYTHTIMSSGRSLLAIISDILDLAKIESGQIQLERTDFNIMAVVKESMDTVSYHAMKKNLKTAVNISEDCQGTYLGDAGRIRQILVNLLNNAVKFTAAGEVSLELSKMENDDLCFKVRDTGSGIPEDQQDAIFERFRQVDGTSVRQHGGTGLGLPICKSLAELMGGRIGVNSEPGVGSEFWFSLPLEKSAITIEAPAWEEPAPLHDQRKADQIQGQRVLVAEDNLINQQIIREALKTMSLEVTIVENGQLALEALEAAPYDLVLMDIQMPVMTGEEAIRWIRASDAPYRDIPIIALTANAMSDAETRYLQAGANAYIVKPINLKTAITTISDILTEGITKS